jgi:hypothetical protein
MSPLARSFVDWRRSGRRGGFALKLVLCLWPSIVCAADSAPPSAAIVNPLARQSLEQLSATLARPLFAASRRKAAPNPTSVAPPREEPPDPPRPAPNVTLVGIISDPHGSQAVLRSGGSAKDTKKRVGDDVDGWKVTDIGKQNLTLTLEDRTVSIVLFTEKQRPGQDANPKLRTHAANKDR